MQDDSQRIKVWISHLNGRESYPVEVHEIDQTIINVPTVDRTGLKSLEHLSNVEFSHRKGHIDLILGVQFSHLHAERDNAKGPNSSCVNFARKINLEKFHDFKNLGIRAPDCNCPQQTMSHDVKKAMKLFASSCRRLNGRSIIGHQWKKDPTQLTNN